MPSPFKTDNEPLSAILHFLGFLLSVAGLVLLVVFASLKGSVWHIVSFTIFGVSLVLLYAASTLFHSATKNTKLKRIFYRIDHCMIYVLIAGTYTPICFITLQGAWGWSLFGVIWGLAILGIVLKATGTRIAAWLSTVFYLLMGWLTVVAFVPLRANLPVAALAWLVAGGIFYSVGALIFSFSHIKFHEKWFGMHEIWHILVMLGSFCHFWVIFKYLLPA